jgi:hypothetical protein
MEPGVEELGKLGETLYKNGNNHEIGLVASLNNRYSPGVFSKLCSANIHFGSTPPPFFDFVVVQLFEDNLVYDYEGGRTEEELKSFALEVCPHKLLYST